MAEAQFCLQYQGPADASEKTLRLIKGVFVADLEFPVPEVQRFLSSAPITILRAEHEANLLPALALLQEAGALVSITKKETQLPIAAADEMEFDIATVATGEELSRPVLDTGNEEITFSSPNATPEAPLEFSFEPPGSESVRDALPPLNASLPPSSFVNPKASEDSALSLTLDGEQPEVLHSKSVVAERSPPSVPKHPLETVSTLEFSLEPISSPPADVSSPADGSDKPYSDTQEINLSFDTEEALPVDPATGKIQTQVAQPVERGYEPQRSQPQVASPVKPASENVVIGDLQDAHQITEANNEEPIAAHGNASAALLDRLTPLPQIRKVSKQKIYEPRTIVGGIVFAVGFVLLNTFYLIPMLNQAKPKQVFDLQAIFNEDAEAKPVPTAHAVDKFSFKIDESFKDFHLFGETAPFVDKPVKISFSVTTPEPSPQTKEEIVARTPPADWIRRIEFKDIPLKTDTDIKLQGAGFAELGGQPVHIAVPVTLRAFVAADQSALMVKIISDHPSNMIIPNGVALKRGAPIINSGQTAEAKPDITINIDVELNKGLVN